MVEIDDFLIFRRLNGCSEDDKESGLLNTRQNARWLETKTAGKTTSFNWWELKKENLVTARLIELSTSYWD